MSEAFQSATLSAEMGTCHISFSGARCASCQFFLDVFQVIVETAKLAGVSDGEKVAAEREALAHSFT